MRWDRFTLLGLAAILAGEVVAAEPRPAAPLPLGASLRLGTTDLRAGGLGGHEGGGFALFPDGKLAATVNDTAVQLWDLSTGRVREAMALPTNTGLSDEALKRLSPKYTNHTNRRAVWSPDGQSLIVPWRGLLFRYPLPAKGEPTRLPLIDDDTGVSFAAFAQPDDTLFALANSGTLHEFRPKSQDWEKIDIPAVDQPSLMPLCLAVGTGVVATGGRDGHIRLWSSSARKALAAIEVSGQISGLSISADGKWLVANFRKKDGEQFNLGLWSLPEGKRVQQWHVASAENVLALNRDGTRLAIREVGSDPLDSKVGLRDVVCVYDATTGKKLYTFPTEGDEHLQRLAFAPDGSRLFAFGDHCVIHRWDVTTGKPVDADIGHLGAVQVVLALKDHRVLTGGNDGRIVLWDEAGREVRRFAGHRRAVTGLALSPDGKTLYSSSMDRSVRAWTVADGKERRVKQFEQTPEFSSGVEALAVSPDGKTLAVGYMAGVRLLSAGDFAVGDLLALPSDPNGPMAYDNWARCVQFLADGRLIASNYQRSVRAWDMEKKRVIATASPGREIRMSTLPVPPRTATGFAVSPDGKTVAVPFSVSSRKPGPTSPKKLTKVLACVGFWDLETGLEVGRAEVAAETQLLAIAHTPDGKSVLVGDEVKGRIWQVDVESQKVTRTFDSGRHFPRALAVFPDGKGFVSGGTDTTALVWKLDPK